MASVDTNVLVRLLVADDETQSRQAKAMLLHAGRSGESADVSLTVMLELEWVLRSRYSYDKERVLVALSWLLETRELSFQDEAAIENALHYYRHSTVDFAECLHLGCAASAGQLPLMTFDRAAARMKGAKLVAAAI